MFSSFPFPVRPTNASASSNPFLDQKIMIRGISIDDRRLRKQLAQFLASVTSRSMILICIPSLQSCTGKVISHPAAAADDDLFDLSFVFSEHTEKPLHLTV